MSETRFLLKGSRLQRLLDVLEHGVLILGHDQELEAANEAALVLLGVHNHEGLAIRWREVRLGLDAQLAENKLRLSDCPSLEVELEDNPQSRHRLQLEIFPIDEPGFDGLIVTLRDRTMVEALETDLRMAARYRGLNSLFKATAHDLKAPFNAIMINMELLRDSMAEHPAPPTILARQTRYLDTLQGELARLHRSLQVLLTQSMASTEQQQTFDLVELLNDMLMLITPQARQQQVTVETQLPEQPVWLLGSSDWLNQALLNITINALEAMPGGGQMGLTVEARPGRVRLTISDSGPGIPPHVLENIWKMHFTTKQQGTGIGLYVSRNAIESHGGQIEVLTQPGEGTQFVLTLPTLN